MMKVELQKLAGQTGLAISVAHQQPGTRAATTTGLALACTIAPAYPKGGKLSNAQSRSDTTRSIQTGTTPSGEAILPDQTLSN